MRGSPTTRAPCETVIRPSVAWLGPTGHEGPTTLRLSPWAQSCPSRARGLLSAQWELGYGESTPPRPRTLASQTKRLRTRPRRLAGPSRGNSPRGPEEETRASRDPSPQGTLPRRQLASRESRRNLPSGRAAPEGKRCGQGSTARRTWPLPRPRGDTGALVAVLVIKESIKLRRLPQDCQDLPIW